MEIKVFDNYEQLSQQAAEEVLGLIRQKPEAVICLASGNTPLGTCQEIVKKAKAENLDLSRAVFIGLDEWVGIEKTNSGSCHYFFSRHLFQPLGIADSQVLLFDGMARDLQDQCRRMDQAIAAKKGIDLMLVGIGMNGHIGFNEPGVSFDLFSHVIDLDETTRSVGQKYFTGKTVLGKGITLGLRYLMATKKVILLANGNSKAAVIKAALRGQVTEKMPASIMQKHPNGFVFLDNAAASLL